MESRAIDSADWLPYAAVAAGAIAVLTMLIVLREGLGPLQARISTITHWCGNFIKADEIRPLSRQ